MMQSMTRKEAIEVLKGLLDCSYVDSFEPEENEALQIAISSLETDEAYQLEYERTTKNDLGVDKFDKAINQSDLEEWIMETFPDWCEGDVRLIMNHMDEMPSVTPQEPTTKNDLGVDWEELKSKIFMEVDGGTDDRWLRYGDVCDRISNSIDEFKADLPSVTPQEPILDKIRAEIEPKCDRINSLASVLPYTAHREIQELLCEIMDLCKTESEVEE